MSYSRLLAQEAGRLLEHFGAEVRFFDPSVLPLPDDPLRKEQAAERKAGVVEGNLVTQDS